MSAHAEPKTRMRTSRVSRDTTRIFNALSSNSQSRRGTRSSSGIPKFALGFDGPIEIKDEDVLSIDSGFVSDAAHSPDIEDVASTRIRSSRKRKYGTDLLSNTVVETIKKTECTTSSLTSPGRVKVEGNEDEDEDKTDSLVTFPSSRKQAKPKIPARRTTSPSGTVRIHPPSNWLELYNIIKAMRQRNPVAPVDTMGCEDLFWQSAPPKEKRYHTLTALMLSSQTKDTVTAAAMQRLHTELVPQKLGADGKIPQSGLTIENIRACDPKHLDSLIGKVGFHNNKTKYIKLAAELLHHEYNSDIPNTIEGLIRLPGVGPKMAYLCMSAAWGIDEGIGVDVHVHRITNLWGWHNTKSPEETRAWLEGWLPKDKWHEINKMLVGLGQTVCLPIARRCGECDLMGKGLCKAEIKGWKATEKRVKKEKVAVEIDNGLGVPIKEESKQTIRIKEEPITV